MCFCRRSTMIEQHVLIKIAQAITYILFLAVALCASNKIRLAGITHRRNLRKGAERSEGKDERAKSTFRETSALRIKFQQQN